MSEQVKEASSSGPEPGLGLDQVRAVILAGGFGTRVQHLLPGIPKPMAPVLGRPFLEWVVRYLAAQGVRDVVFSLGHLAEVVERHFALRPVSGVTVRCVKEPRPLGTAGGFLYAASQAGPPPAAWLVLNGDSLALASLVAMAGQLTRSAAGVILGVPMADASRFGTLTHRDGRLLQFEEKKPGAGLINAGIYLLRPSVTSAFTGGQPVSFERDVFPALARRHQAVAVYEAAVPFLDIGTPESLPLAESFIGRHRSSFTE